MGQTKKRLQESTSRLLYELEPCFKSIKPVPHAGLFQNQEQGQSFNVKVVVMVPSVCSL